MTKQHWWVIKHKDGQYIQAPSMGAILFLTDILHAAYAYSTRKWARTAIKNMGYKDVHPCKVVAILEE